MLMKTTKTSHIAVISNYNDDPTELSHYFNKVLVYDQSDKFRIEKINKVSLIRVNNPGHSLKNYFHFIVHNYENLPDYIYFLKSNVYPRHICKECFESKVKDLNLQLFFCDHNFREKINIAYQPIAGYFMERNNNWYIEESKSSYFASVNEILDFLFSDAAHSSYVLFAPGANYGIYNQSVYKYPIAVWEFLEYIVSYKFFPPESFLVERILLRLFCEKNSIQDRFFTNQWKEDLVKISDIKLKKAVLNRSRNIFMKKLKKKLYNSGIATLEKLIN